MTSEIRNSVPLNEMPIEDLVILARSSITRIQATLTDNDKKVDKSVRPVERATSLVGFLNDTVLSAPEISTYFKRTNRRVTLVRGSFGLDGSNIHIQRGKVRLTPPGISIYGNLPEKLSPEDGKNYLFTPELITVLYDQNKERHLIRGFAGMSRLRLLNKIHNSIL